MYDVHGLWQSFEQIHYKHEDPSWNKVIEDLNNILKLFRLLEMRPK